ncbi:MAG: ABC transporter ATP-binding protein, partial [Pseudomonadota bacterium]
MRLPINILQKGGWRAPAGVSLPSTLRLEGVGRRFGSKTALDAIDLTVEQSEILCLLGHSGCGKSTLLRLVAGLTEPTSGRISIDGREVASPRASTPPEKRGVGMIFQDYALFPHLTLLDNVMFGLRRLGGKPAKAAALAALNRVGLADDAARYPHQMSGGEQQRVALA